MAYDSEALTIVLATDHPDLDEWVFEQARGSENRSVQITSDNYRGVWRQRWQGAEPVHVFSAAGRNRLESFGLEYLRDGKAPAYVHDLLDAFLTGEPLNFKQHPVPRDVRRRLEQARTDGALREVRVDGSGELA